MRICFIGSKNIFIYNFAKYYIEKKGFEVFLITRSKRNFTNEDFGFIKIFYLKSERLPYKIIRIRNIIKQIKPDVVHCFYISRDAIAPCLFYNRKFKYVCSIFGSDIYWDMNNNSKRWLKYLVLRKCDVITCNSFQMEKDLLRRFPQLPPDKIKPIMWGINFDLFNRVDSKAIQKKKQELGIGNEKVILSYRGFSPVYNQEIIFKAIPLVLDHNKDLKFIFILGNTKISEIQPLISLLNPDIIANNVIFIEKFLSYEELSTFLNLSDIVINIPKTDQFALSLLETMASRAIPILSNISVYRDVLKEYENAIFLHEINEYELASKIIYVIDNYDILSSKIIFNNNLIVKTNFNFHLQTEKMISLYN
jgi:glycosyltransferase involved in cell wall biosynthesis